MCDSRAGLTPDAVRAEYAACDLALLASEQETAPVTIAEAMAAGRAVVTTDVGGCAAMVEDGVTGRVVPPRAPAALAVGRAGAAGCPGTPPGDGSSRAESRPIVGSAWTRWWTPQ